MARKVSLECLLPTVLLPASDQDIEADLAELKVTSDPKHGRLGTG